MIIACGLSIIKEEWPESRVRYKHPTDGVRAIANC